MPRLFHLARRLRSERAAADPILVIASIVVAIILLTAGGFAAAQLVGSNQDADAQKELRRIAATQQSVFTAMDEFYLYDSHPTSAFRLLENPGITGTGVGTGFEPRDSVRTIVDVDGAGWVAVSKSKTGKVFLLSSAELDGVVRTRLLDLAMPDRFTAAEVQLLLDSLSSGTRFDFTYGGARDIDSLGGDGVPRPYVDELADAVAPTWTTANPPVGKLGVEYRYGFIAAGEPAPTYTLTSGALPAGVTLDATSGRVSGIPTAHGVFPIEIRAANIAGQVTQARTITIQSEPVVALSGIGEGRVGTAYSGQVTASATPAATLTAQGLPPGVTFTAATGRLGGTPTTSGVFTVTFTATNSLGSDVEQISITVRERPTIASSQPAPAGQVAQPYSYQVALTKTVFDAPRFTASALPPGVTINPVTGLLSGTPTTTGTYAVQVTATNGAGSHTGTVTVAVSP